MGLLVGTENNRPLAFCSSCLPAPRCGTTSPRRPTRTSWTWVAPARISTAASRLRGASTVWIPRTSGYVVFLFLNPPAPSLPHPLTSELPGYPFELLIKGTNVLSNGSFLLQTPDEMGHLSSINGCGVRSCDSLWEKRTNVSRDFFLCVRAEESLPINRLGRAPFARGSGLMAPAT